MISGDLAMSIALTRSGTVTGAVLPRASASDSDEILVTRIAAGDKLAMQVLFARHRTAIYRWLYRFVGNETVAEDLLSDVFFDVWQQAGRFKGRSAVPLGCSRSRDSRHSRRAAAGLIPS